MTPRRRLADSFGPMTMNRRRVPEEGQDEITTMRMTGHARAIDAPFAVRD